MFRILAILILTFCSANSFASTNQVAVIVNDKVITEKDIFDRKNFIILVQNLHNLKEEEIKYIKNLATESLIDDILLEAEASKHAIKVSDEEIESFIKTIEDAKELGKGFFKAKLAAHKDIYESFIKKTKTDVIKQKINGEILSRGISISNSEIDDIAIRAGKDAIFSFREISINSASDKAYAELRNTRNILKDCSQETKIKDVTISKAEKKLSELSAQEKELFVDLKAGEYTAIINSENGLKMYQLCSKKLSNVTEKENDYLMNYIGSKKLHLKMLKFMETIRKKAYIKYL